MIFALAWLYLAGLLVSHRLQAYTPGRALYGSLAVWACLLAWPVAMPVAALLWMRGRK